MRYETCVNKSRIHRRTQDGGTRKNRQKYFKKIPKRVWGKNLVKGGTLELTKKRERYVLKRKNAKTKKDKSYYTRKIKEIDEKISAHTKVAESPIEKAESPIEVAESPIEEVVRIESKTDDFKKGENVTVDSRFGLQSRPGIIDGFEYTVKYDDGKTQSCVPENRITQ
jgi:hypothetical protein